MTTTPPNWAHRTAATIGRHAAMALVRTAAAAMAGWSLYVVARHYSVPQGLALAAGLVFDGVAYMTLRLASDAVRAGRSAAGPIAATLGMAAISIYLNLVHARFTGGGRPAEVLYASPAVGLLVVSTLAWSAERAAARADRGETPMRMPAYGALGWVLAGGKALEALKDKAEKHVTSGASMPHQPASPVGRRDHRALLRERFAAMDPAEAVEIAASSHPDMSHAELVEMLATYGITVNQLDVALILGEAAVPTITLDRVPQPAATPAPAIGAQMRPDATAHAPQVTGLSKADAITAMARHLGGLDTPADAIATALAQQGRPTDTAYIRHRLSKARRAAKAAQQQAEKSAGTGFYP
ncbi:hypothetical protein ABT093_09800 [Kitasatospora sp. NPDC002551]|uniref:hypothetical protein n=1 Tax=Kitasatospora sp. NPDC002551 TaxID=3154539 RepID=UPI00332E7FBC